ncbi:hypothetical protein AVEN_97511-1 [Araneus ventricosus]|uniref:Uncharacterized protein n=1 Tax=Araneus ventricosus TaxID=182803 RepID=A0A4Y2U5H8_ARAVE|nr:hypothetical protein AVEN_46706-1 [Araneus ventricosus]GBO07787.1 hypothetical protein AVEN_198123-1 [Araneus ventricosus]GBO36263.1 hypothetical protein AVEN_6631-1 [Araneus ventricosus]GBO36264.1 hypothetical protein AVEN_97511-1 [Araneus ventricosus]
MPRQHPCLSTTEECCIQKLTNNVAVVWRSAVLLKDDTFWKLWNCIQLQHGKGRCLTAQSDPHGAWCCVITCARTPLHYRPSLGYCPKQCFSSFRFVSVRHNKLQ